jgi:hypothetical protein
MKLYAALGLSLMQRRVRRVQVQPGQRRSSLQEAYHALPREPGQAAASISEVVDVAMNSSRVWQTIADGARLCADAWISAFRA